MFFMNVNIFTNLLVDKTEFVQYNEYRKGQSVERLAKYETKN